MPFYPPPHRYTGPPTYYHGTVPFGSLVVTAQPLNTPPRIMLVFTQFSPFPTGTIVVNRRNDDGTSYTVRSANPAALTSNVWVGYDYDAPFAQGGVYTATAVAVSSLSVSTYVPKMREFGVVCPWLIHPGIPSLSMPITIARDASGGTTLKPPTDVNQGVFNVLGREDPIIRTDGVRRKQPFTLTVSTYSWEESDALEALLSNASTLLLQVTYPGFERGEATWVSVSTATPTNMVGTADNEYYRWALTCTPTGSPIGVLQAQWSCASVLARYATVQDVLDSFATDTDLIIDNPIPV